MTNWVPVKAKNPPAHKPILIVTNERALQALAKPSLAVDVGIYVPETDSYRCLTEDMIFGEVIFWAPLPDVPWELVDLVA